VKEFIFPTDGVTQSHPVSSCREVSFNENIGIMLRSYTRAVNKQEQRVGALFREETKAECINYIYCGMRDGHLIIRERAAEFGIKF